VAIQEWASGLVGSDDFTTVVVRSGPKCIVAGTLKNEPAPSFTGAVWPSKELASIELERKSDISTGGRVTWWQISPTAATLIIADTPAGRRALLLATNNSRDSEGNRHKGQAVLNRYCTKLRLRAVGVSLNDAEFEGFYARAGDQCHAAIHLILGMREGAVMNDFTRLRSLDKQTLIAALPGALKYLALSPEKRDRTYRGVEFLLPHMPPQ
jgi:hypothetical protein